MCVCVCVSWVSCWGPMSTIGAVLARTPQSTGPLTEQLVTGGPAVPRGTWTSLISDPMLNRTPVGTTLPVASVLYRALLT